MANAPFNDSLESNRRPRWVIKGSLAPLLSIYNMTNPSASSVFIRQNRSIISNAVICEGESTDSIQRYLKFQANKRG